MIHYVINKLDISIPRYISYETMGKLLCGLNVRSPIRCVDAEIQNAAFIRPSSDITLCYTMSLSLEVEVFITSFWNYWIAVFFSECSLSHYKETHAALLWESQGVDVFRQIHVGISQLKVVWLVVSRLRATAGDLAVGSLIFVHPAYGFGTILFSGDNTGRMTSEA